MIPIKKVTMNIKAISKKSVNLKSELSEEFVDVHCSVSFAVNLIYLEIKKRRNLNLKNKFSEVSGTFVN